MKKIDPYNKDGMVVLSRVIKMPRKTLAQRKKRAELILEHYNDEYDNEDNDDDRDDRNYMEGLRDGYSRALNDLGYSGNPS